VVLAYDDIGDDTTPVVISAEDTARHLRALLDAGFHFVTLQQIEGAYYRGERLPEHAVLLTFDLGLRATHRRVDPILKELGISAVLFVDTGKVEVADRRTVYWDRLRDMTASGHWEIGTHGHTPYKRPPDNLFDMVAVRSTSEPAENPFLRSKQFIEENVDECRVRAFAPRTGVHFAFARNEESKGRFSYNLGFWDDLFGVNDDLTDPHWLLRLRVDPQWPAEELRQRVEWAATAPTGSAESAPSLARWRGRTGRVSFTEEGFDLAGDRRNDVWLLGSQWLEDWELRVRLHVDADEFWITQENRLQPGLSWRFGGTRDMLYLQRRKRGGPPDVLASATRDASAGARHEVRLVKRGTGVWIEWDGEPLFHRAISLPGRHLGKVGFVCAQADGQARMAVRDPRLHTIPYRTVAVSGNPSTEEAASALGAEATLGGISPPHLVQRGSSFQTLPINERRLKMLCGRHALDLLPAVKPGNALPLDDPQLRQVLQDRASASGWGGYLVDLRELSRDSRKRWIEALDGWKRAYHRAGLRLIVETGDPREASP